MEAPGEAENSPVVPAACDELGTRQQWTHDISAVGGQTFRQIILSGTSVATYEAERRPLAADVIRGTSANTRFQTGSGPVVRLLRERVATPLLDRPVVQRWATAVASQLWVSYRTGPLAGVGARFGRRPRQGDRVPDLSCRRADGTATRLHAELGGRWALVGASVPAAVVDGVEERLGRVAVLTGPGPRVGEVWLVRPDAHLAWRGPVGAPGLRRWLCSALERGTVR